MISQTDKIDEIVPIFRSYLAYMSRFYTIVDVDAWSNQAVKNLQQYVASKDRLIYIFTESSAIIGFAMINKHLRFNQQGMAIAEFHIQKDFEGKGYGRKLAEHVFAQFPGHWEVAITIKNNLALAFWKQVVSSYTSGDFIEKRNTSINEHGFLFNKDIV